MNPDILRSYQNPFSGENPGSTRRPLFAVNLRCIGGDSYLDNLRAHGYPPVKYRPSEKGELAVASPDKTNAIIKDDVDFSFDIVRSGSRSTIFVEQKTTRNQDGTEVHRAKCRIPGLKDPIELKPNREKILKDFKLGMTFIPPK